MPEVVLIAEMEFEAGREDEGLAVLEELCAATHANDAGCLTYALYRQTDQPTRAVMVEKWESAEALKAHGESPHILEFRKWDGFAKPSTLKFYDASGYGEPDKGYF